MPCLPGRRIARRSRTLLALLMVGCEEECGWFNQPSTVQCGARLDQIDGDAQEVQVGAPVPRELVVRAFRTAGSARCSEEPRSGETIRWVIVSGGGTVSSGATVTDAGGEARIRWTLGTSLGVQSVTAQWIDQTGNSTPVGTVTFNAVGLSAPYYVIRKYAGDGQTGPALARVTVPPEVLAVTVRDAGPQLPRRERPMELALIKYEVITGGGTIDGPVITTGLQGRAARDWVLGPLAGPQTLTASFLQLGGSFGPLDTVSVTFTATAVVEPVRSIVLSPNTDIALRIGESAQITARTFTGTPPVEATGRSVAWQTTNTAVATVVPNDGPSPSTIAIMAQGVGTAQVRATSEGVSATVNVTVTAAPARQPRIAYGVAHNGVATSPYAASLAYNSSGGPITIARSVIGVYQVTFAGQRAPAGESETILISGYGTGNHYCQLVGDWSTVGNDVVAQIECFSRTDNSRHADVAFSVMLLGSGALPGRFGFAFADQPRATGPYTPPKSYNSGGLNPAPVSITRTGVGNYLVTFPGNAGGPSDPEALHVTAVKGSTLESRDVRCNIAEFTGATAHVRCYDGFFGNLVDVPFSITLLDRGRPGFRAGVAWTVDVFDEEIESPGVRVLEPRVSYSNPAGTGGVTLSRVDVGTFYVVFNGIAAVDKSPVLGIQVVDRDADEAFYCNVVGWGIEGNNLRVTISCFHSDGEPEDESFFLIVIQ
jgi:uncharacterized protein YjdB